jgi:branched-chain amino acid transport system substrate-binding protein
MRAFFRSAALAAVLFTAAPLKAAEITVCIWGSLTGPDALVNGISYAARDYFEFLNQTQRGIAGNQVRALLLDGRYKLDEELKLYRRCVDREQAVFVNGWSTGAAKALRDQINQDAVPFMTQSGAGELVNPEKLPFMFIPGPTYEQQIVIALRDAARHGGKRVVILHPDNEYGRGPVGVVRQSGEAERLGLTLETIEFAYDAQDITAQLLRIKASDPDLVFVQGSTPQVLVALRDAAKVGMPASKFAGSANSLGPAIPQQLGAAAEGYRALVVFSDFGSDIPAMEQIGQFMKKNEIAKRDVFYMRGWFEGIVMARAIEAAVASNGGKVPDDIKAFRKSVRDEMVNLKNIDTGGITPPADYSNHQGTTQARVAQIKNGRFVPVGEWFDAR